jgi:hypothetical protein
MQSPNMSQSEFFHQQNKQLDLIELFNQQRPSQRQFSKNQQIFTHLFLATEQPVCTDISKQTLNPNENQQVSNFPTVPQPTGIFHSPGKLKQPLKVKPDLDLLFRGSTANVLNYQIPSFFNYNGPPSGVSWNQLKILAQMNRFFAQHFLVFCSFFLCFTNLIVI